MIDKVKTAFLFVEDQQRALDFYTQKLGWEVHADAEMWEGARWLEVVPPGAETTVTLAAAKDFNKTPVRDSSSITLSTPDANALYEELKAKGVEVTEPKVEAWATFVKFRDPDGHEFLVAQESAGAGQQVGD